MFVVPSVLPCLVVVAIVGIADFSVSVVSCTTEVVVVDISGIPIVVVVVILGRNVVVIALISDVVDEDIAIVIVVVVRGGVFVVVVVVVVVVVSYIVLVEFFSGINVDILGINVVLIAIILDIEAKAVAFTS